MKKYIIIDGNIIISSFLTNDGREGTILSNTEFNKIKWEDGKIYKLINKKIVVEDDPNHEAKVLQGKKTEKENAVKSKIFQALIEKDSGYRAKKTLIDSATTIKDLDAIE